MIEDNGPRLLHSNDDEDATARLLRTAGPRPEVPVDRAARVRDAVHLVWQAHHRRRTLRRQTLATGALVATAAALVLVFRLTITDEDVATPAREIVATVERVEGHAQLLQNTPGVSKVMTRLSPEDNVRTGEWVDTGAAARVALRLSDGTSVRLDIVSRARLISSTVIELAHGALYLDTGSDSKGLEVRTPLGIVHDIGTQFEIRMRDSSLRLRVRTGVVELRRGDQAMQASAGTELALTDAGTVSTIVSAYGPQWEWAVGLSPAFEIEGRPLAAFLEHLSREHGWKLRYADAALARDASSFTLHGSVNGLQPEEALRVTLTASGLFHRFRDGELFVSRTVNPQ